ncbi:MAG: lysozyme [Hyphomicrobiaceae bacterium]
MHHSYLEAIKSFEGFTPKAAWDYAQFSNGYGTKALYPGEAITPEEAERRFAAEIAAARAIVEKHAAGWDEGTKAALTSLTFNAGTRWIASGLGEAVRNQDIEAVKERFLQYTKAGGEVLPGLVRRRLAELDWIGSGGAPTGQPARPAPAIAAGPPPPPVPAISPSTAAAPPGDTAQPKLSHPQNLASLRDGEATEPTGESTDTRSAQALSMFLTLMFDLQMRSALADPLKSAETRSERQERTT